MHSQHHHGRHRLSVAEIARANQLAVAGALKWVNFPVLADSGAPPKAVTVTVDGKIATRGLNTPVQPESEVCLLPSFGGG